MQSGFCLIVRGKSEIITKTFAWMIRSSRICRIPILFIHASRDEIAEGRRKRIPSTAGAIPRINLEDGMPLVEEAVRRMHMGSQEMKDRKCLVAELCRVDNVTFRKHQYRRSK